MEVERQFDKRKSNIAKGLAILILLCHHIFYDYVYNGKISDMKFLFQKLTFTITQYGSFVIFVFAAISGYGISAYMRKKENNVRACIVNREIGLLGTYVPVFFWGVLWCILLNANLGFLYEVYGESKKNVVIGIVFDMFGLSGMFGMPKLNPTWWYMGAAHSIIVFVPILVILADVIKSWTGVLLAFAIFAGCSQTSTGAVYRACVLAAYIGAWMYEKKVIEKAGQFFGKKKFGRLLEAGICIGGIYLFGVLRELKIFNWYYLCAISVPFILIIINDFVVKISGVSYLLEKMGEQSSMIYMLHTFVVSIIPTFSKIVYSLDYAYQAYLFVLLCTLVMGIILKAVLKIIRYDKMVLTMKAKILEYV